MTPPAIQAFLDKARESIDAAKALSERGSFGFATSRAYYAMFYTAQALLLHQGKSYSRHSAVIAALGRELIKPGLLDRELHRYIREAFDARQVADYDPLRSISEDTADRTLRRAEQFLAAARVFLRGHGVSQKQE